MRSRFCPVCGERMWYPDDGSGYIHKCRDTDGTRLQKREFKFHPNRQIIKWDSAHWNTMGGDLGEGFDPKSKENKKRIMRELTDVETFIEV